MVCALLHLAYPKDYMLYMLYNIIVFQTFHHILYTYVIL